MCLVGPMPRKEKEAKMKAGELIPFGAYVWQVLAIKDNGALLITKDIIGLSAFHNRPGEITWAESGLRKYLNEAFY